MTDERRTDDIPEARERHTRWIGWVWSLPVAAALIVGYLALQQITRQGHSVTVTFPTGATIKPGDTKVQYQGLQVGTVNSVKLQPDLHHVNVRLSLTSDMDGHLGPGTRFWIVGGKPSLANLGSIKTIITGPFIEVGPRPGKKQDHYDGLSQPPPLPEPVSGRHYTLIAGSLGNVSAQSAVVYHGLQVGTVESVHLQPDGKHFAIVAFVRAPFDRLVHEHSHFWNAGAVQLAIGGTAPQLQFQSLPALLDGAIAFATPDGAAAGKIAAADAVLKLYKSRSAAENAPVASSVRYRVIFSAAEIGGLESDAPVRLLNQTIGSVLQRRLQYDPRDGHLTSHLVIALDPTHFTLADGARWHADARAQMDDMLQHLIDQGLRARIGKTVPLVGGEAVVLDFVPHAGPAALGSGDEPIIPTAPRSDIQGLIASIGGIGAKLDAMPIDQIAGNVLQTTQKLAELSNSPELKASLQHLDQTLTEVDAVARTTRGQIGPILLRLRAVADAVQSTVASARRVIANNRNPQTEPDTTTMSSALYEVSRAARSLRELADYLDRHPEALLYGKRR